MPMPLRDTACHLIKRRLPCLRCRVTQLLFSAKRRLPCLRRRVTQLWLEDQARRPPPHPPAPPHCSCLVPQFMCSSQLAVTAGFCMLGSTESEGPNTPFVKLDAITLPFISGARIPAATTA